MASTVLIDLDEQHFDEDERGVVVSWRECPRGFAPIAPVVYLVRCSEQWCFWRRVVKVGKATDVVQRLQQHRRERCDHLEIVAFLEQAHVSETTVVARARKVYGAPVHGLEWFDVCHDPDLKLILEQRFYLESTDYRFEDCPF